MESEAKQTLKGQRQRGLFPLPLPKAQVLCEMGESVLRPELSNLSSKCRRRVHARTHVSSWVRDMVTSLNSMYCGHEFAAESDFPCGASLVQELCLERLSHSVQILGKPPNDMTGPGALRELQATLGYSGEPASLASFREDLLSLPPVGGNPSSLETIVGPAAEKILKVLRSRSLSFGEAAAGKEESGLKAPYMDPILKKSKSCYVKFVRRLLASNLVEFRTQARERVGLFCVWKKSGKQRMIVDSRLANQWFSAPEKVELATGTSFTRIEVDAGPPIEVGGVDIADCFYNILLPEEFRDLFALRPLPASEFGVTHVQSKTVSPSQLVFPVFRVVPMGFTHALWICQQCHLEVVDSIKEIPSTLRFVDGRPVPQPHAFIHTEYVDNFVALSQVPGVAAEAASRVEKEFNARGLPTHPVESGVGLGTLGWHFDATSPCVTVTPRRLWKLRLGVLELLKRGWADGKTVEKIVGHLTFVALLRRELLSCFQACYIFIRKRYTVHSRIWPEVGRELRWAVSLLPLVHRNLSAEWSDEVFACDASLWGRGVVSASKNKSRVRMQGQYQDRWRFNRQQEKEIASPILHGAGSLRDLLEFEEAQSLGGEPKIPEVDLALLEGAWKTLSSQPWQRLEPIVILEGRSLVWVVQHLARSKKNHEKRHLILTDSMSSVLALSKGRGGSGSANRICCQVGALSLACGFDLHFRWIASELNPADNPSRRQHCSNFNPSLGVEKLLAQDAPSKRSAGASWRYQAARFYRSQLFSPNRCEPPVGSTCSSERSQEGFSASHTSGEEIWESAALAADRSDPDHFFGEPHNHSAKVEKLSGCLESVSGLCSRAPPRDEGVKKFRCSSNSVSRSSLLRRCRPLHRSHPYGSHQISPERHPQVVSSHSLPASHEGLSSVGARAVPSAVALSDASRDHEVCGDSSEAGDGCSLVGVDVGVVQSPWRALETVVESGHRSKRSKQKVVSGVVRFLPNRRKVATQQNRHPRRGHRPGSSLPGMASNHFRQTSVDQVPAQPSLRFQHHSWQQLFQGGRRRAWVSRHGHLQCLPSAAWVRIDRHVEQAQVCRRAFEKRTLEKLDFAPSLRAGWSPESSVWQSQRAPY